MSITPTPVAASVSPRPYADTFTCVFGSTNDAGTSWMGIDLSSTKHHTTVDSTESKRLTPGSFAGVLT